MNPSKSRRTRSSNNPNCLVAGNRSYVPGCCAGADCPMETKCSDRCPQIPDHCHYTDCNNWTLTWTDCIDCPDMDPNDLYPSDSYIVTKMVVSFDCVEFGTAIRPENGQLYKWAIGCGPVIAGPVPEENRGMGEYQCAAARQGASYSHKNGGWFAPGLPCQLIQLVECGCGPADMYTFGFPAPSGPCLPDSGCPFLCEDAGVEYARDLCHAFPGNISWWGGENAFHRTLFLPIPDGEVVPPNEYEIYIKGVDL